MTQARSWVSWLPGVPTCALALLMGGCNFNPPVWPRGSPVIPHNPVSDTQVPEVFLWTPGLAGSHLMICWARLHGLPCKAFLNLASVYLCGAILPCTLLDPWV